MTAETDIAVTGVGCRFPDAPGPAEFWRNLDQGLISIRDLSQEQLRAAGVGPEQAGAADFVAKGTWLPGAADFAGEFFGYAPAEAEVIDPQQRLFLECAWEAMESAGHAPNQSDGPVTGVFAGSAAGTYSAAVFAAKTRQYGLAEAIDDLDLTLGGQADFLTSRAAYKLGLRGPAVSVQTACSSSLYAVHYASLSLLSGECDIALAGGATVLEPLAGYRYKPGGLLSQDGYCRSFDSRSTGTSFGSGVGVVVLRRLADALADGDPILAVLRGSAVGNDGAQRQGYTAPNPQRVAEVVGSALRLAEVGARDLRYVEAHGSGTALGDSVELLGLTRGMGARAGTKDTGRQLCALGSVKTNIGHCGPAAGIAGFIKAIHIARTGSLPPHPMFDRARDPGIMADSSLHVTTSRLDCDDAGRHVLVNSMGVGGTNVAAVLAAPPEPVRPAAPARQTLRLVLSARNRAELDAHCVRVADFLDSAPHQASDIAHTLKAGRTALPERRVVTGTPQRLAAALRLPRPPAARTTRAKACRALIVLPPDRPAPEDLLAALTAALPATTETVTGPLEQVPANRFAILLGNGETGPDQHVLPLPQPGDDTALGSADHIDDALAAAWLHGVAVNWDAASQGVGRRLALPTYPFQRRRYWALDRLPGIFEPLGEEAAGPRPAPVTTASTAATTASEDIEAGDPVTTELTNIWRTLFGLDSIGTDDEFGDLGGSSLLSVRMVLEIQERLGVLVNVHRAGGSRTTVRRIAEMVRGLRAGAGHGSAETDAFADGDGDLIDADLALPLGDLGDATAQGTDLLLTGATGFLGAFILNQLLEHTPAVVHCLVRADSAEQGWNRLCEAAAELALPKPDPARVHVVPGDLREIGRVCREHDGGALAGRIGHVLHCAARVVFTEPYRVLRADNVLPVVDLLAWMRENGIGDFSFVSTVAATAPALGANGRTLETRGQSLDPQQGGYGAGKWVVERLLERAEADGMRVRIFRPGFILASSATGGCNSKDLIWHFLASGLAIGAHPADDRGMPMAPVDLVARAIAELALSPGAVGRAYHLVDEKCYGLRKIFALAAEAGLPTRPMPTRDWQQLVSKEALATDNEVLSTMALYEMEGHQMGEDDMEAAAWQGWLSERGLSSAPTGRLLRSGLTFLAERESPVGLVLRPALTGAAQ